MYMVVQLGTRDVDGEGGRGRNAELAAVGGKMRERETKGRGMKVEGDVVKDSGWKPASGSRQTVLVRVNDRRAVHVFFASKCGRRQTL